MPNKYAEIIQRLGFVPREPPRLPLTEEQLADFEQWQGYPLPADYREFLRDYGGIGARALFPFTDERREHIDGVIFMFFDIPLSENRAQIREERLTIEIEAVPTITQVIEVDKNAEEVLYAPDELLAIAIDQGGNSVYLALAGKHPGKVFQWRNWDDLYFVADSFDEFMHSLRKYD